MYQAFKNNVVFAKKTWEKGERKPIEKLMKLWVRLLMGQCYDIFTPTFVFSCGNKSIRASDLQAQIFSNVVWRRYSYWKFKNGYSSLSSIALSVLDFRISSRKRNNIRNNLFAWLSGSQVIKISRLCPSKWVIFDM